MLYEITAICQKCADPIVTLIYDGEVLERCASCGDLPFSVRAISGIIYVVRNPNQKGVKIGITNKSVEQRIKTLNSTGVAGRFQPIAIFPSERPAFDEKRVHDRLRKYRIEKEHFDLEPADAVLQAYRALNKRNPIFHDEAVKEQFHLKREQARIEMKLKLSGSSSGRG
jgi:hypothetical protein